MPVTVTLISLETEESVSPAKVDDQIREHLQVGECVDDTFYENWWNIIGFGLATGKDFDELKEIFKESETYQKILDYLKEHYRVEAYYAIG